MRQFNQQELDTFFGTPSRNYTTSVGGTNYTICKITMPNGERIITIFDTNTITDTDSYESTNNGFWQKIP